VPYWDVDPRQADVEVVGDLEASPFRAPDGKLRVFGHYMDEPRIEALTAALGPPAGTLEAELTSSFRTVLVYPPDGRPYMLKFPGSWFLPDRQLTASDVARSVARSRQLRASPDFLPEPAGLVASGVDLAVLYRPLPLPRSFALRRDDFLVAGHVLSAPELEGTALGRRIFGRYGSRAAWENAELAPALARTLRRSIAESFVHPELHAQNLDVLIDAKGRVRRVFIKDLLDVMHDFPVAAAQGHGPTETAGLRDGLWKTMGEAGAAYDVEGFHREFLAQSLSPRLERAVRAAFVDEIRAVLPLDRLTGYPELSRLRDPKGSLYEALSDLWNLLVKTRLGERFEADDGARESLVRGEGELTTSPSAPALSDGWAYGFIGEVPVAVRYREPGAETGHEGGEARVAPSGRPLIEHWAFRFP
jgi:hypothetical protein